MTEHKSERIKEIAIQSGWRASVVPVLDKFEKTENVDDIEWVLYCIRNKETIKAVWRGNLFRESVYSYGAYRLYPARSGSVIKLLKGEPDLKKISQSTARSQVSYEDATQVRNIPWEDNEEVPAFNVLVAVVGKSITWVRKTDGQVRSEACPKESNLRKSHFRLTTTSAGKRVLEWCNSFGFQACYLEDIIDVT